MHIAGIVHRNGEDREGEQLSGGKCKVDRLLCKSEVNNWTLEPALTELPSHIAHISGSLTLASGPGG